VATSVCVFDVNETLLDIEFIEPMFQRIALPGVTWTTLKDLLAEGLSSISDVTPLLPYDPGVPGHLQPKIRKLPHSPSRRRFWLRDKGHSSAITASARCISAGSR
jgi:hypothetical protein